MYAGLNSRKAFRLLVLLCSKRAGLFPFGFTRHYQGTGKVPCDDCGQSASDCVGHALAERKEVHHADFFMFQHPNCLVSPFHWHTSCQQRYSQVQESPTCSHCDLPSCKPGRPVSKLSSHPHTPFVDCDIRERCRILLRAIQGQQNQTAHHCAATRATADPDVSCLGCAEASMRWLV